LPTLKRGSGNGRRRVEKAFEVRGMVARYEALYREERASATKSLGSLLTAAVS
jgi:hypothetical protein